MTGARAKPYLRFTLAFAIVGGLGLAASIFILIQERAPLPFRHVYTVNAQFIAADGVASGLGQPVNVAGVKVGQVTNARLMDGRAVVTMEIRRDRLPRLYANARAMIEPITPLQDLEIDLDPGHAPARPLRPGATIGVDRTRVPVPASDLLRSLDSDTRTYLSSLIGSLDQGTRGRGEDIRRMMLWLGPTTAQVGRITRALAQRRAALARLVHNLAVVAHAASRDRQLATVVAAGNQTLGALARQDKPLRAAIAKLPATLAVTRTTLTDLEPFARKLGPTVSALLPSVARTPATLRAITPFADAASAALRQDIRPFVRESQPLIGALAPTVTRLGTLTPHLSRSFQALTYLTNELAYNPPGNDEGFLFWFPWFFHNFNSVVSSRDAHGGIGRAFPLVTCEGIQNMPNLQAALGISGLCPK